MFLIHFRIHESNSCLTAAVAACVKRVPCRPNMFGSQLTAAALLSTKHHRRIIENSFGHQNSTR